MLVGGSINAGGAKREPLEAYAATIPALWTLFGRRSFVVPKHFSRHDDRFWTLVAPNRMKELQNMKRTILLSILAMSPILEARQSNVRANRAEEHQAVERSTVVNAVPDPAGQQKPVRLAPGQSDRDYPLFLIAPKASTVAGGTCPACTPNTPIPMWQQIQQALWTLFWV
jgi:hypothetical protein